MWLEVSYASVRRQYPELVNAMTSSIRKGKSKCRNTPPGKFTWGFSWSVLVQGNSLDDIMSGNVKDDRFATDNEEVADYEKRAHVTIVAKMGRNVWRSKRRVDTLPREIRNDIIKRRRKQEKEDKRWKELTPEQQQKELNDLIGELSKDSGFMAVQL